MNSPSAAVTPPKKKQSRWFRMNLWIHRWISLVIVIPFLILCLTGTVLIFHEEVDHLMGVGPKAESTLAQVHRHLADSILAAQQKHPGEQVLSTGLDPEHFPGVFLMLMAKPEQGMAQARILYSDIASAKLLEQPHPDSTLTGFLLKLHAEWFLGPIGQLLGALIAFLVLLSLISGLVVYAPYVKRFLLGIVRRGRGKRLFQLDLHNLMGSMVFGWALVVTITGFLLGFSTVAIGIWQITELSELQHKYSQPLSVTRPAFDIDHVYTVAATAQPGWRPSSVFFPGSEYSTKSHYMVLLNGQQGLDERLLKVALVDANTGTLTTTVDLPLYLKAILLSQPLHFGDYGGMPLKILWTLCTWMTLFITANGAWLWWAKRRKKKHAGHPAKGAAA